MYLIQRRFFNYPQLLWITLWKTPNARRKSLSHKAKVQIAGNPGDPLIFIKINGLTCMLGTKPDPGERTGPVCPVCA
jgi:hypothetical protein